VALEHIAPAGVHPATGYTHVVRGTGASTVYVSGQVGVDKDGKVAEGLEAQARQAFANLRECLAAVGADFSHVAKMTIYIVNYSPEARRSLQAARQGVVGDGPPPASTLIGVQALAFPEIEIEVEAIAVLD